MRWYGTTLAHISLQLKVWTALFKEYISLSVSVYIFDYSDVFVFYTNGKQCFYNITVLYQVEDFGEVNE